MKPLIEESGKRGLRVNNKRKNFKTANAPIEHEAGTIRDKTHPTKSCGLKKSKLKKLQEKNARQSENSSARITLKKEIPILEQEANEAAFEDLTDKLGHHEYFAEELFDDSNFSIGHSKLIDSPRWVVRKKQELDKIK